MQDVLFKANSGQFNIDEAQGIVECFVAGIGNKDSVGDICASGAFAKSLQRRKPRVVWGHNWNDPIGKVLEIYEVAPNDPRLPQKMKMAGIGGLYAKVQFNLNSEKGREAFTNVAFFGEEQEWSIGYKTLDAIFDNAKQANVLREVELYELSPVLHGANQLTGTISVKTEKTHETSPVGMVVLDERPYDEEPSDPFSQGLAQPLTGDRLIALTNELSTRTGGPIKVMKATESSIVFLKPGKGLFRLGYHFTGEEYMFGKPEKLSSPMMVQRPPQGMVRPGSEPRPMERIPNFPGVQKKPHTSEGPIIPVSYGESDTQSGLFDSMKSLDEIFEEKTAQGSSMAEKLQNIVLSLQDIIGYETEEKSAWMIPCNIEDLFKTKQALDPVLNYHRIESFVTEEGIVLTSPMDYEAFDAVDTATKSLLGRIGGGLAPGGRGKARRARGALSRIEGILDPNKRRDIDGDGMIFDGTWREMPDPTKFKPSLGKPNRGNGLRSETTGPDAPGKPSATPAQLRAREKYGKRNAGDLLWYQQAAKDGRNIAPILIPRSMKPKIDRMFDDHLKDVSPDDDSIVSRIAKAIKESVRYTELEDVGDALGNPTGATRPKQTSDYLPDIDEKMVEELQAAWPQIKDSLREHGRHRTNEGGQKEKGQSAFDVLEKIVETGEFQRVNKKAKNASLTPEEGKKRRAERADDDYDGTRVGKGRKDPDTKPRLVGGVDTRAGERSASANRRKTTVFPDGINEAPMLVRKNNMTGKSELVYDKAGQDLLAPYVEAGIFPEDWRQMDAEKQFQWLTANMDELQKQETSPQWKVFLKRLDEHLGMALGDLEDAKERDASRKPTLSSPKPPDAPKKPTAPEVVEKPKPKNTPSGESAEVAKLRKNMTGWSETIAIATNRDGVDGDFANAARDAADRIFAAAFPDDDEPPTMDSIQSAMDELDISMGELGAIERERKLSSNERATLNFFNRVGEFLEDYSGQDSNNEEELDADQLGDALDRRGRRVTQIGLDEDDEDLVDGADVDDFDGEDRFDDGYNLDRRGGFSSRTSLPSIISDAQRFQQTHRRKKQGRGGGLSSSTSSGDKAPRTEIITESTWWKTLGDSLPTEISKADSAATRKGLTLLQQKISKYDAASFRPNSKRTNVGSIKISANEADEILDAVMAVIDRQASAGKGGAVGSRGEIFAELLEKISSAAMSTFVDKTSRPVDA
jgi:HK97 family phage prohead protease